MELTETAPLDASALPTGELAGHLRLGTGFADDGLEAPAVESALRAGIAVVERRTGRALITRGFVWRPVRAAAAVPLIPVAAVDAVEVVRGVERIPASGWRLTGEWMSGLPCADGSGPVEVSMTLGFGPWDAVPADLRQAAILIGAAFYEARGGVAPDMPAAAAALMGPWRRLRIGGGA
jgi:uncharacterized phiE125 gp8 family phage protein